jgi:cytochrome c-type biogenesis protein CcmH/NrfF
LFFLGVFVAIFPKPSDIMEPASVKGGARAAAGVLIALFIGSLFAPPPASAQDSSTLHAGTVEIHDPNERRVFERLLCECGDCQRLPLDTCACGWAEGMRAELRGRMARGDGVDAIVADYRERFGPQAIAIPSDHGLERALWALPVAAIFIAGIAIVIRARRWARTGNEQTDASLR